MKLKLNEFEAKETGNLSFMVWKLYPCSQYIIIIIIIVNGKMEF